MSRLSKAFRSVVNTVSSVAPIASLIPGPIGAAGMALTAANALTRRPEPQTFAALPGGAPIPDWGPISALPVGMTPAVFGGLGGMASRLIPGAGALVRAGAGVLRTAAGKLRGVVLASGKFVSSKKAAQLAKRVGIDAAAAALGVSAVELAEMVLADQERAGRGRSRGVSGRDIKTAKRTIRTIERLHRQIVQACRSAHVPTQRHHFARKPACPPVRLVKVK